MEASDGALLSATDDHYQVQLKSGLVYHFPKTFSNDRSPVTRISDPSGNALFFDRHEGVLTHIRDSSGQCILVTCRRNRLVSMQLQDKLLVRYHYDNNQLTGAADALGHQKHFYYQSGRLIRHMDKNKLSFYYAYDTNGRCIHTWGDGGLYEYRFDHRPYEQCVRVTDSLGHVKTYFYDKDRLPVKVQDPTGATIAYAYDDVGRVITVTDPLDRSTVYEYDPAGNVLEITRADSNRVVFVYDDNHRPIQLLDANGKIWEQRFDQQGRLIEKISPIDERIHYRYNNQGDLVAVTDPEGRTTTIDYDEHGLVSSVSTNNHPTRYQRDRLGNITAIIDAQGRAARYLYDDKSRLIQTVPPSGAEQRFEWDGEENLLLYTDPGGQQTRFEYGGVNEIVRRTNADGTCVAYQYDTEENLIALINEKEQTHRFEYDHAGRVIAQTDYFGHTTRYAYDRAGQLCQSIDPLEKIVTYAYDPVGRLQSKTFESQEQEFFNWDANGNLVAFQSPDALVERFYDAANHLIAEKSGPFEVQYQYDLSGRRTGRTTSHGNSVQYSYDASGAVAAIQINDQAPVTIERNHLGQITNEQFSQYMQRSFDYNEAGQLTQQTISSDASHIERRYDYDPSGHLIAKHDSQKGPWKFSYDPMGRITEAIDPEQQLQRFGFDPAGDLLEHMPDIGHGLRCARHNNTVYQYDAAGNLAERQNQDSRIRFEWDEQNRLKTARTSTDTRITMAYDALGRRHIKAVNGERTHYTWDGDALLSEQHENGPAREYVYYPGTFEPLAVIDGDGQIYYYHNDPNGLPQELTKPNGEIVWSATYDAMGRVDQILVDDVAQPLRMQGQYWDEEIKLCYNRHRYFDPQICSFISQDPLGLAAGENVYAYAPNVWGWADPLGLCVEESSGTATVHWHDNRGPDTAFGHYSVETDVGGKTIHTHQLGAPGTDTMISTDLNGVVSSTKSHTFDLPNAKAAQEFQLKNLDKIGPSYDTKTRSCVTHVGEVLREGGLDVPTNPGGQFKYLKKAGL
jgi:RHS repeat-associated protein